MSRQFNPYHIECLKHDIELKFGRTCKSPSDFKYTVYLIKKESGEIISDSTLRRLWGYSKTKSTSRLSTLTTLARVLGFIDWDAYVVHLMRDSRVDSDFINSALVNGRELQTGDLVSLSWLPDRRATLRCIAPTCYEVVAQANSKLLLGDVFKALFIRKGMPLICSEFTRGGARMPDYIAGAESGICELSVCPAGSDRDKKN